MKEWRDAKKILVIRLDSLGDILMATPAIEALKSSGDVQATLLTSPQGSKVAPLLDGLIDDCLVYEAPWMKHSSRQPWDSTQLMSEALRGQRFDAAFVCTTSTQSSAPAAMLCFSAGIPLRAAYSRENPYQLLTHFLPESDPWEHEVKRHLRLVKHLGIGVPEKPKLYCNVSAKERMVEGPYIVLHPGATAFSRRYSQARYKIVAAELCRDGWQILVTGSSEERELCAAICDSSPLIRSLAGSLSVEELAILIRDAALVITNNTGPAHIAAALETPVVVLYALTNPQHTPWSSRAVVLSKDVPCRNCLKSVCPFGTNACLDIAPEEVLSASRDLARRSADLLHSTVRKPPSSAPCSGEENPGSLPHLQ